MIPPPLRAPALFEAGGLPRFWATVWTCFLPGDLAQSTLRKHLAGVESFYRFADELLGVGGLDDAVGSFDVGALGEALEAYFISLRNKPDLSATYEERWQVALRFSREVLTRMARSAPSRVRSGHLQVKLASLEELHSHLSVTRRRRPERVRSLPVSVVEALYELLDPEARRNPFQNEASRWRAYVIFILLLHQGLRRGELLSLSQDAIRSAFDAKVQRDRNWLTIRGNPYQVDPRYSKPGIKTADSIRQVPVGGHTVQLVDEYVANYRGRPEHSFLINSQKNQPLSTEGITKLFQKITCSLPSNVLKVLKDERGDQSISAHDLRHTCAVLRLNQLLAAGVTMEEAMQQMRSFFGWARSSDMPLRYARTVFEDRLASVWRTEFDERVEVLRNLARI